VVTKTTNVRPQSVVDLARRFSSLGRLDAVTPRDVDILAGGENSTGILGSWTLVEKVYLDISVEERKYRGDCSQTYVLIHAVSLTQVLFAMVLAQVLFAMRTKQRDRVMRRSKHPAPSQQTVSSFSYVSSEVDTP